MNKKSIPLKDAKILWGRSGSKCALCKTDLIREKDEGNKYPIGEMAHIGGEKPGSARYNPHITGDERQGYSNLILLCPNCHATIDNDYQVYTVEKLRQIKKDHEGWVSMSLKEYMVNVTFAELEVIIKHLMAAPILKHGDYITIIPPKEKNKEKRPISRDRI